MRKRFVRGSATVFFALAALAFAPFQALSEPLASFAGLEGGQSLSLTNLRPAARLRYKGSFAYEIEFWLEGARAADLDRIASVTYAVAGSGKTPALVAPYGANPTLEKLAASNSSQGRFRVAVATERGDEARPFLATANHKGGPETRAVYVEITDKDGVRHPLVAEGGAPWSVALGKTLGDRRGLVLRATAVYRKKKYSLGSTFWIESVRMHFGLEDEAAGAGDLAAVFEEVERVEYREFSTALYSFPVHTFVMGEADNGFDLGTYSFDYPVLDYHRTISFAAPTVAAVFKDGDVAVFTAIFHAKMGKEELTEGVSWATVTANEDGSYSVTYTTTIVGAEKE